MSPLETWVALLAILAPLAFAWALCLTAADADRRDLETLDQWEDQWPTT